MFANSSPNAVNFPSCWTAKEKRSKGAETQTEPRVQRHIGFSVVRRKTVECQTEQDDDGSIQHEDDPSNLAAFMKRIEPVLMKELNFTNNSQVFAGWDVEWEVASTASSLLHTLDSVADKSLISLSWSSGGAMLAHGFGELNHENWCNHPGQIIFYSLDRAKASKQTLALEMNACVTALSFHPKKPSVVAAGTFNGEVIIIDFSGDDTIQLSTIGNEVNHLEQIVSLCWISPDMLFSGAADGQLLQWRVSSKSIKADQGFQISGGLSCLALSPLEPGQFLAGNQAGEVHKCSLESRRMLNHLSELVPFMDPVVLSYSAHSATVYAISCSPFERGVFATCSADGGVRLFNSLTAGATLQLDLSPSPLYSVQFSPTHPLYFAAAGHDGNVYLVDLRRPSDTTPLAANSPVSSLSFHPQRGLLAAGCTVWQLSDSITVSASGDEHLLRVLCEKTEG